MSSTEQKIGRFLHFNNTSFPYYNLPSAPSINTQILRRELVYLNWLGDLIHSENAFNVNYLADCVIHFSPKNAAALQKFHSLPMGERLVPIRKWILTNGATLQLLPNIPTDFVDQFTIVPKELVSIPAFSDEVFKKAFRSAIKAKQWPFLCSFMASPKLNAVPLEEIERELSRACWDREVCLVQLLLQDRRLSGETIKACLMTVTIGSWMDIAKRLAILQFLIKDQRLPRQAIGEAFESTALLFCVNPLTISLPILKTLLAQPEISSENITRAVGSITFGNLENSQAGRPTESQRLSLLMALLRDPRATAEHLTKVLDFVFKPTTILTPAFRLFTVWTLLQNPLTHPWHIRKALELACEAKDLNLVQKLFQHVKIREVRAEHLFEKICFLDGLSAADRFAATEALLQHPLACYVTKEQFQKVKEHARLREDQSTIELINAFEQSRLPAPLPVLRSDSSDSSIISRTVSQFGIFPLYVVGYACLILKEKVVILALACFAVYAVHYVWNKVRNLTNLQLRVSLLSGSRRLFQFR